MKSRRPMVVSVPPCPARFARVMQSAEFDRICRRLLDAKPFAAFSLELIDGRTLVVTDPRRLAADGGCWRISAGEERTAFVTAEAVVTVTTNFVRQTTTDELMAEMRRRHGREK